MTRHVLLSILLGLASVAAFAQDTPPPAPAAVPAPLLVMVTLETEAGDIKLALDAGRAPITTANFLRYVDQKRFDGVFFYRSAKYGDGIGLIQGGTRGDPKHVLKPIAHEPTTQTGITHDEATISMARNAPGSATGDFFITVSGFHGLDADPTQPGDNSGFAAFGHVVEGMDVVRKIFVSPTSPTEGEGVLKGQMLAPPIFIISARRSAP